ncbi:MAG: endonuclease/exonuclease/phosphatase family protein [Bacteroidales bacterium]|nr:endonuclease/exonuclease/phosphatase family protein [Bacteroidales bacterium]
MKKAFRNLIKYLNYLAAFSLLISYSAPFIDPSKILFPAFFGLIYPYILLVNLIFLIYWIIRFRKELLISLLAIIIGWTHLMNFLPMNFSGNNDIPSNNAPEWISIMSYNVRTFDKYKWSRSENSREGIFRIIKEESPAVICFQEFYTVNKKGRHEVDIIDRLKTHPYNAVYYARKSSPNTGIGIATFSKYPIVKTSRIPFDNTLNQAVYTDIWVGNDTVRIFNIHLQSIKFAHNNYSFIDTLSLKYSNQQIKEVKEIGMKLKDAFIQRSEQSIIIHRYIKNSPHPVIVAGDFNDTPVSFAYTRIKKGLHDAFREAGRGLGNTYAGDLPSFRIDFILYSKEIEATGFKRIKSRFSDHFPISARLVRSETAETNADKTGTIKK